MVTDPIADFLTRIRNAQMAGHTIVDIPASNMKKKLTQILFDNGYILQYRFDEEGPQGTIKIALKYNQETRIPAIRELVRISKPGLRKYTHVEGIPRVKKWTRYCHNVYIKRNYHRQRSKKLKGGWRNNLYRILKIYSCQE
jgi:small subunit ribosomal protein S8